jgi:nitroimidazol reductase NimA-like FMN-containing flavoprotein (pyridoxamine 5'-phosphate oxidase superfamily)
MSVDSLPVIVPVEFCIDDDRVVFAVQPTGRLAQRVDGAIVAFEADVLDPAGGDGWSVLVQGPARYVDDRCEHDRLSGLLAERSAMSPCEAGGGHQLVSMTTDVISGRRMAAAAATSEAR